MIEAYIKNRLKQKEILLMTHIVMGYPSFDASFKIVEEMVKAGVDQRELGGAVRTFISTTSTTELFSSDPIKVT